MKKLIAVLLLLAVAAGVGVVYLLPESFDVYLSEGQIQDRVEEAFPVEERYFHVVRLELSEPRVTLVEGSDRIQYGMRARVSIAAIGEVLDRRGRVSGTIRYDADEAAFYSEDFRIEELDTSGIPGGREEQVVEAVELALRAALRRYPLYELRDDDLPEAATRLVLRDAEVIDGRLRLRMGLRRLPIPGRE